MAEPFIKTFKQNDVGFGPSYKFHFEDGYAHFLSIPFLLFSLLPFLPFMIPSFYLVRHLLEITLESYS
jgi:hypothetical protein